MTATRSTPGDGDVIEVEFAVTEPVYPFVSIAQSEGCRISLQKLLPRTAQHQAEYFRVEGADPERVVERVDGDAVVEANTLAETDDHGLVEFVVQDGCPAHALATHGAMPTTVEGTPDGGTIVAEIMPTCDPSEIVDAMVENFHLELVAKRTRSAPTPLVEETEFRRAVFDRLTDRQEEVLVTAYEMGYYERPRRHTGEEIAAALSISPTTFQEHVRAAERKFLAVLVEEE